MGGRSLRQRHRRRLVRRPRRRRSRRTRSVVRATLQTAASNNDYLDVDDATPAIAAAAIVASGLPGGESVTSPYAPAFLLDGGSIDLEDDLPLLAIAALDRILGSDSEWHALWIEGGASEFPVIERLRAVLSQSGRA